MNTGPPPAVNELPMGEVQYNDPTVNIYDDGSNKIEIIKGTIYDIDENENIQNITNTLKITIGNAYLGLSYSELGIKQGVLRGELISTFYIDGLVKGKPKWRLIIVFSSLQINYMPICNIDNNGLEDNLDTFIQISDIPQEALEAIINLKDSEYRTVQLPAGPILLGYNRDENENENPTGVQANEVPNNGNPRSPQGGKRRSAKYRKTHKKRRSTRK